MHGGLGNHTHTPTHTQLSYCLSTLIINFREPEILNHNPINVQSHQNTNSILPSHEAVDSAAERGDLDMTDDVSTHRNPAYEGVHLLHQYDTISCPRDNGVQNPGPVEEGYTTCGTH